MFDLHAAVLCCGELWEDDAVHLRIWLDIDDGTAIEGIEPLNAEGVSLVRDEFGDTEGEGVRPAGRAARKDTVNLFRGGWDGLEEVPLRQMCPVEDDEVFVLLDFEQSVRKGRVNLDL